MATGAHGHEVRRRVRLFRLVKLSEWDDVVHVQLSVALILVRAAPLAPEAVAVADDAAHTKPIFAVVGNSTTFPIRMVVAYPVV